MDSFKWAVGFGLFFVVMLFFVKLWMVAANFLGEYFFQNIWSKILNKRDN